MPATKIARFIFKSRGDKFRYKRESASLNVDKVFDTLEEAKKFKTEIEPKFAKAKEDAFKKRGEKIKESKVKKYGKVNPFSSNKPVSYSFNRGEEGARVVFKSDQIEDDFKKLVKQFQENVPYQNFPDREKVKAMDDLFMSPYFGFKTLDEMQKARKDVSAGMLNMLGRNHYNGYPQTANVVVGTKKQQRTLREKAAGSTSILAALSGDTAKHLHHAAGLKTKYRAKDLAYLDADLNVDKALTGGASRIDDAVEQQRDANNILLEKLFAKYKKTTDPVDQNRLMNEMEEINKLQDKIYSEFGDVLVVKKFDVNKNKIDFLGEPKGSLDPGGTLFGDKFLQDFTLEDTVLLDVSRNMRKFGPDGEILYKAKRDIDAPLTADMVTPNLLDDYIEQSMNKFVNSPKTGRNYYFKAQQDRLGELDPAELLYNTTNNWEAVRQDIKQKVTNRFMDSLISDDAPGITRPGFGLKDGGRVKLADGSLPPVQNPTTDFDTQVKNMMNATGLDLGDSVLEVMKDNAAGGTRENYKIGGIVGDPRDAPGTASMLDATNKIGGMESLLAGIGAGLLDIPKGAFTLGASLMDLGVGTNNAAKVEDWFDNLNDWDDKAEQHWLGTFSRIAVNLGVPGAYGWRAGEKLARRALLNKRNGNYFKLSDPELPGKFQEALNAKGRLLATLGAAGGAGVSDAIFVGDPEGVGTFGDMIGMGPTELDPNDENQASKEIVNRMKFGLDGSLMVGLVGGAGSAIKSLVKRRNDLSANNDKLDKFFGAFRPRGQKSQLYFDIERRNIGARAGDVNYAGEQARKLDKHIDAIFPFVLNPFKKMDNKGRQSFMRELNDTLLSGDVSMDSIGKVTFGDMDKGLISKVTKTMRDRGAKEEDIAGVFDSFGKMRLGWGHIFSRLGYSMDDEVRSAFSPIFGEKFRSYLGSTYEMFQNKSVIPLFNYKPTEETVEKTIKMFMDSAEDAGKPITRGEAEVFVDRLLETARPPRDLATTREKTSGIYFDVPDFFVNRTTLSEIESARGTLALEDVVGDQRKIIEELFGKVEDPMQTMLTGTNRLSLVGRRNQFYNTLLTKDKELALERADFIKDNPGSLTPATMKGLFRETEKEAVSDFGRNIKQIEIDPSKTIEAGSTNPLHGKYAEKGVAEAIEESAMVARDKSTLTQLYESFLLYPKATSQLAKTVLSPVTHARNFISAGAFASANGLIPGLTVSVGDSAAAFKEAFQALQVPGARMANDRYRDLLRLGVVNSNVRLGDLQRLLKDTNFGESVNSRKALREMFRPLSKLKKTTEDFYTAEDDFWKITSFALERQRLGKAYEKYKITRTADELDEEAADIIRNNIPNYDMVNDFIKATRRLPLGNFVSFPAEIYRTSGNIISRAMKEINYKHTLDDGRIVYPLRAIGLKRAFGMGTTTLAIPYGTVEAFKALHDVTEDEMAAMRRFVPDWSKNSTLIPMRDDDGGLKYIDFSHANAYDTMIRPLTALYTGIQRGANEGDMGQEVLKSMIEGTKEALSPFVSESIWTTGISDIVMRGGRTREGNRLYTDQTPIGEKFSRALAHVIKTQMPGSIEQFKRLDRAFEPIDVITKGKFDKYGQDFEIGNELQGFLGFRAVEIDPVRAMKFKIADFRTGINNARREFTSPLLRGGPVSPEEIVDRYRVASDALYKVQEKMFNDYYAARTLGTPISNLDSEFADRVSKTQLDAIKRGEFKPFVPSENIEKAFADNARAIGDPNPYMRARSLIKRLIRLYDGIPLGAKLPETPNPFRTSSISQLPILQSQALQGLSNIPTSAAALPTTTPATGQQTALKGQQVFGTNDTIFGVG
tara:strand:+ start:5174 stop:10627 length:5454 start_codon:yes stop_codon:yes gene_type:complete